MKPNNTQNILFGVLFFVLLVVGVYIKFNLFFGAHKELRESPQAEESTQEE